MAEVRLKEGKGAYLRRGTPEGIEQICECVENADFSLGGCPTLVHPDLIGEVLENAGEYSDGMAERRGGLGDDHRCFYCYARRHNKKGLRPKVVGSQTRRDFEEKKPRVVRAGKWTDPGHVYYLETLRDFAELCGQYGTGFIFTTKLLPFGRDGSEGVDHTICCGNDSENFK